MNHIHRAIIKKSTETGWVQCITPDQCAAHPVRQTAHGNIVVHDVCVCGATRQTEVNGRSRNFGSWQHDESEEG